MADKNIDDLNALASIDGAVDLIEVWDSDADENKYASRNTFLGLSSEPVGRTDTQTLTNKTLTSPTITGPTFSGTLIGTYTIGGTPTFPSTVATLTGSQTLTNKTLTSPTINTPTITNPTLATDVISEHSSGVGVTIDSMLIKDGTVGAGTITPAGLVSGAGSSWVWQDWAPSYTNITVGNGTANAVFIQIGKTVHFRWQLEGGTTTALGSGMTISLPVAAHADYATYRFNAIGIAAALDLAPAIYNGWTMIDASTTVCTVRWNDGTAASNTAYPFTEATGDFLVVQGTYEAA